MNSRILHAQDEPRIYWCRVDRIWKNDGPVQWYDRATNTLICVEPGKPTDLASVPFWLRWFVAVYGNWNRGAIVHDDLYRRRGVLPCGKILPRKQCDRIFLDIAIVDGTNPFVATVGYYGIRINPANWPWFKKWGGQK